MDSSAATAPSSPWNGRCGVRLPEFSSRDWAESAKTTLARGFLQWLDSTGGLGEGCFWLGFQEIRSAEYVFNRLGEAFFGGQFATVPMDKKIEALAGAFNEHRFIIVWDNFESAAGIAGTAVTANLPDSDRKLLADFLDNYGWKEQGHYYQSVF